jgi:hypothetical protein
MKEFDQLLEKKEDYKNFPIDVFPSQVTEYMQELRDKLGCNPNYMAGAFITACSICIGRSKAIQIRDTWREWAVFWNIIIGEAGSKKTPSTAPFMKPIRSIESEMYKDYLAKCKAHSDDVSENKPLQPRLYVGDATIEAYIQIHSQNLRGVAIVLDEISGLVANSGKYNKGSDIEKYLSAFSYSDISAARKGVGMSSILYDPYLPIFGGIQPKILTSLMTEQLKDNGFWDRFLFVSGNFQTGKMTKEDVAGNVSNNYDSYVRGMFELIKETEFTKENGDLNVDYYHMDNEAKDLWFDYNGKIEDMISDGSELSNGTKSAYSKMATYFGRFILLMHILDSVYVYPFHKLREAQINVVSVEKAIRLVKYFMFQYELVSKEVSSEKEAKNILFDTKGMTIAEKVKLLHTKDPNMSQRALAKHFSISVGSINKILNS